VRLCSDATEASYTVRAEKSSVVLCCWYRGLFIVLLEIMNDRQNTMV
jgi:hypothetical protein